MTVDSSPNSFGTHFIPMSVDSHPTSFGFLIRSDGSKSCEFPADQLATFADTADPNDRKKKKKKEIVAKVLDGQRYPCPALVGCACNWGGAGQRPRRGQ